MSHDPPPHSTSRRLGLKAVYDDDLPAYLASLGINAEAQSIGSCKYCGEPVALTDLAALFPESGSIKLVCSRSACLLALQDRVREGKTNL